jgi:uncharacterized protein (DUF1697 family)
MERFRAALALAGGTEVRTLGTSGNAVLRPARPEDPRGTELAIESALARTTGLRTEAFVRTLAEWDEVVRGNPFPDAARTDPSHLVVAFLSGPPSARAWEELRASIVGREQVVPGGRHGYVVYPDGIGRSRLTAGVIERHLGVRSTSRNWNTVLRVLEELGGDAPGPARVGRPSGRR